MSVTRQERGSRTSDAVTQADLGCDPVRCTPQSIFSWNYDCVSPKFQANLSVNWLGEQGKIQINGRELLVRKHGLIFPTWSLHNSSGGELATAVGSGVFQRRYTITDSMAKSGQRGSLALVPSFFGQTYAIERNGRRVADIAVDHPFTRKSTITPTGEPLNVATAFFCFYLVTVNRRRQSNN